MTEPISKRLKGLVLEIASKFDLKIIEQETDLNHIHVLFASKRSIRGKPGQEMIIDTRKSFKYRIYPTKAQTTTLENQMSMCRHLYNWSLAERKEVFENSGKSITYNAQQNRRPDLKKQRPWFKSVHSQVLQDALRRLDRAYQNFFQKKRTSKYRKLLKAVHKCHYRIRCRRQDFLHKAANALLDSADVICHEKLNIKGMSRRPKPIKDDNGTYLPNRASIKSGLNKSINDAGWHQFLLYLKYKAAEQGKQVIGVPAQYTFQMCCACGQIVKKPLSVRTHRCPF